MQTERFHLSATDAVTTTRYGFVLLYVITEVYAYTLYDCLLVTWRHDYVFFHHSTKQLCEVMLLSFRAVFKWNDFKFYEFSNGIFMKWNNLKEKCSIFFNHTDFYRCNFFVYFLKSAWNGNRKIIHYCVSYLTRFVQTNYISIDQLITLFRLNYIRLQL